MADLVLNRYRELVDIGYGLDGPAPMQLIDALAPELQYNRMYRLPYDERRDPVTNDYRMYGFEPKCLFVVDDRGRFVTQKGFAPRILKKAKELGFICFTNRVMFPQMRPGRFDEDWVNLLAKLPLRYRQDEMFAAVAASETGTIVAAPGFGKSLALGGFGLLYPNANIVAVTASVPTARTILTYASKLLPDVGMVGGGSDQTGRFTIYVAKSLANRAHSLTPDILLGDEAHELVADGYSEGVATAGRYARCYGFTATPKGRADKADAVIEALFGPVIFQMDYREAEGAGLVVPIHVIWHDVILPSNPIATVKRDDLRRRYGIWRNKGRNLVIASIADSYTDDDQLLIMVDKVEHALVLGALLPNFRLCFRSLELKSKNISEAADQIDESRIALSDKDRDSLRRAFECGDERKVIATDVWSRGVSFNELSILIRADARQSMILGTQIPGRVSRTHAASGKTGGIVHDLLDQFDEGTRRSAQVRKRLYAKHGWTQVRAKDGRIINQSSCG